MKTSKRIRILIFAILSIFSVFGLTSCIDVIYKVTGNELIFTKSANPLIVSQAGQVITYTYVVHNNLEILDWGHTPLEYAKYKGSNHWFSPIKFSINDSPLDGPVVCSLGNKYKRSDLNLDESATCTATYTVKESDITNCSITNNATVTGSFDGVDHIFTGIFNQTETLEDRHWTTTSKASQTVKVDLVSCAEPTPIPTSPVLTGEVPYCDPAAHTMNLRFVAGFDPENNNFQVKMGGVVLVCEVNSSNKTVLTCKYPDSAVFPTTIQVTLNGTVVNDFDFDGFACTEPDKSNKPNDTGPSCVPLPGKACP